METREQDEFGEFVYDEDLRNDLVVNNMALVTALSDFAANNPKIMGLEEGKRVTFDRLRIWTMLLTQKSVIKMNCF